MAESSDSGHDPEAGRGAARGASSLREILDELQTQGFDHHFFADRDGIRCGSCRQSFDPNLLVDAIVRRLEGASDPADELLVVAASCPICDAGGALTLPYGPGATADDEAVLTAIDL